MKPPSTEAEPLILVRKDPSGVPHILINRPRSLNSLTRPMMVDLARAFCSLDADYSAGVIVLSGTGRSYCSAVDLTAAEAVFKGDDKNEESDPVCQLECRKPIIGAITGFTVTVGFEIALACDVLVTSRGAKFIDTRARRLDLGSRNLIRWKTYKRILKKICCLDSSRRTREITTQQREEIYSLDASRRMRETTTQR